MAPAGSCILSIGRSLSCDQGQIIPAVRDTAFVTVSFLTLFISLFIFKQVGHSIGRTLIL